MSTVLYLGVEGLFFKRRSGVAFQKQSSAAFASQNTELLNGIVDIVQALPDVDVVLNSWAVADIGFRTVLSMLPHELATRTIGATLPGNRKHRNPNDRRPRVDMLRADISRRQPERLAIVDAFASAVPFEYASQAVILDCTGSAPVTEITTKLTHLLKVHSTNHPAPET
ncbi:MULTISPECIES: hypothetical protein [Caballeronia]|uniref:hypothetical protein n=1 Tax=Caballeronia TaxID=1827195 RepID=UPI00025BAD63|nr:MULTISPECIES: hypothetical protein [Caballeronia]EKS70382.1 hypothetical protein BURK_019960 [Burkholderia sp. SJ98]MCE4546344.1 hypothetical protein [Caballeronia sp. PC1]MCE4573181.1 hypothetical protein [Caballeronia sp. CLC5]